MTNKQPYFTIEIKGSLPRSGKTALAAFVSHYLAEQGFQNKVVCMDDDIRKFTNKELCVNTIKEIADKGAFAIIIDNNGKIT